MFNLIPVIFKTRLALWALEMVLPSKVNLKHRFRLALLGVIVSVAGGVLGALVVFATLVLIGAILHMEAHLTILQAAFIMGLVAILLVAYLFFYGKRKLKEAFVDYEEPPRVNVPKSEDVLQELIDGLIEGFVVKSTIKEPKNNYEI
jgi:hypothetical protein